MSAKSWLIVSAIAAGLGGWAYMDHQKKEQAAEERRTFEKSRISTADPLLNLAGCMANSLTPLSEIQIGSAIFNTDMSRRMTEEQVKDFEDVRDVLLKSCAPKFWQPAIDRYQTVTYPMLHSAMFQVMRDDPGVKAHIQILQSVRDAVTSAYVKQ